LLERIERDLTIENARIDIVFADIPTATALAHSLDQTDREARRVVAGFELGARPESLRGRGVRLVPTERGLRVERAEPGSLDVVLLLGGLYQAVTSQPLSFALNLAALLGYGRAVLRAVGLAGATATPEISVELPAMPVSDEAYPSGLTTGDPAPPPGVARVQIPSSYSNVLFRMRLADGTCVEIECSN
jgi:hypothetical protein